MADALCGPSNPLQQFKQQTQLDRTIQQDRLRSRLSPTQGFRSQNPNAGVLDPEFEAFQAGVPLSDLPQFHQQPPAFAGPSQTPSWAADFQRMQVSSPPVFQQQHLPHASPVTANWANGFQQHIAQNAPRAQTSAHSPQAFQQMARYGTSGLHGFQNTFAQPSFAQHAHTKGKEPVTEQFDDAAFEAAFDQAREDMLAEADAMEAEKPAYEAGVSTADFEVDHEAHVDKVRRQAMAAIRGHLRTLSQEREAQMARDVLQPEILERLEDEPLIEEAIIEEQVEQEDQSQQEDDDALAATAKELLEKVEHNKSEKFKNSQFLNLMRKLRDREMKVEGDQMVETADALTATTDMQGLETSTTETQDVRHLEGHTFKNITTTGNQITHLGTVHDTSNPLGATHVDTRPPDYSIPEQYQDHDAGRIDPNDGQEVVDYLNRRDTASPDDIDAPEPDKSAKRNPWPGWATPSWASGYYYPKDMEPDWLGGLG